MVTRSLYLNLKLGKIGLLKLIFCVKIHGGRKQWVQGNVLLSKDLTSYSRNWIFTLSERAEINSQMSFVVWEKTNKLWSFFQFGLQIDLFPLILLLWRHPNSLFIPILPRSPGKLIAPMAFLSSSLLLTPTSLRGPNLGWCPEKLLKKLEINLTEHLRIS